MRRPLLHEKGVAAVTSSEERRGHSSDPGASSFDGRRPMQQPSASRGVDRRYLFSWFGFFDLRVAVGRGTCTWPARLLWEPLTRLSRSQLRFIPKVQIAKTLQNSSETEACKDHATSERVLCRTILGNFGQRNAFRCCMVLASLIF